MREKVHYLGSYIGRTEEDNYVGNVPGRLKMRYIGDSIKRANFNLEILSFCKGTDKKFIQKAKVVNIDEHENVTYILSFTREDIFSKFMNRIAMIIQLFYYIMFKVKKGETVILYHSIVTTKWLSIFRLIKKIKVILEVEEIYGHSAEKNLHFLEKEIKYIEKYKLFILVNDMLPKKFNLREDQFVVSYGVSKIPARKKNRLEDGLIHVVYAGTIEMKKRGAFTAIEIAEFLPNNYRVHILGFGKESAIEVAKEKIDMINNKKGCEMVKYHGMLNGEELSDFLHMCHIGLSTYVMREEFANSVFPSKLTSYVCHDLSVVMGYAECYEKAKISDNWVFYYDYEPRQIADAIMKVDIREDYSNQQNKIVKLDNLLIEWLKKNC